MDELATDSVDLSQTMNNTSQSFFNKLAARTMERPEKLKLMYSCQNGTTKV